MEHILLGQTDSERGVFMHLRVILVIELGKRLILIPKIINKYVFSYIYTNDYNLPLCIPIISNQIFMIFKFFIQNLFLYMLF